MAKNSNGDGTVRQRPDGRWEARMTWRDDHGVQQRRSFYGATQREARAKMRAARARVEGAKPVVDARTALADWIDEWSATTLEASSRKPATKALYRMIARVHLSPGPLGATPLAAIRPQHVDALTIRLRERGLSDSTIRTAYTVLRTVLESAVHAGLIAENMAARVKRPAVERHEARHLSAIEVRAVLAAASGSRYAPALSLIASTGLRRGEALALTWADVDLDGGELRVRATLGRVGGALERSAPKSANSRREVPLTAAMATLLRRQRIAQAEERLRAGSRWQERGYVFTTELGAPIEPRNLFRAFTSAVARSGVDGEGVGIHTLRHSAATSLLEAGVPLHVVSRILGHSSVAITGDIYGHVSDSRRREAMDALGAAMGL